MLTERKLVFVTRKTRLQELKEQYCTLGQAQFYLENLGESFEQYLDEDSGFTLAYQSCLSQLKQAGRVQVLDRTMLLPNYLFAPDDIVIVLGQDGLVANTLKYLEHQPVIAVNPLPNSFDGVLLPFVSTELKSVLVALLQNKVTTKQISMAEVVTNVGERLLAVNDLFIGPKSHGSARYSLQIDGCNEQQSSSGVIVSTGLGSTGWFKSILAGASGMAGKSIRPELSDGFAWDSRFLYYSVREPFPSAVTTCNFVFGKVEANSVLTLRSKMSSHGVIFSDGIEQDAIAFNAGVNAEIKLSQRFGNLVIA